MDWTCVSPTLNQQTTDPDDQHAKHRNERAIGREGRPLNRVRIGFGGGCHWCTEAVFQSLRGVGDVQQGFIRSLAPHDTFSEAVIVTFDPEIIPLAVLVDVHLRTHASTSAHKMRGKYRSAVYGFSDAQRDHVAQLLGQFQQEFEEPIVTSSLIFDGFKPSPAQFQDYYRTDANKPFCRTYIDPKLAKIRREFGTYYDDQHVMPLPGSEV